MPSLPDESDPREPAPDRDRLGLGADCERCFGLCCVAPAFSVSADFAIDKEAGRACPHLRGDFRCDIHESLRQQGFPGCTVYDCFGAGQKVAQVTFAGKDWRRAPQTAPRMFAVFTIMRQLHELLWYLSEALTLPAARPLHPELGAQRDETERLTHCSADAIVDLDVAAHRRKVNALLLRASELVRGGEGWRRTIDRRGADLAGADLRGADLRGANLRGSCLIGADLRDADVRAADLLGADFRATDLRGADLGDSIFLTQCQLEAAKGDADTRLPRSLARPTHWSPSRAPAVRTSTRTLKGGDASKALLAGTGRERRGGRKSR
jgi:uncharacterized protein YjbI with pentapeptide repeats